MKILSDIILDILEEQNIVGGTSVFAGFQGFEPADVTKCVTIYDTGNGEPTKTYDRTESRIENQKIQVRVKDPIKQNAYNKVVEIVKYLEATLGKYSDENIDILSFNRVSDYIDLGLIKDTDIQCYLYTVNFDIKNIKKGT